MVQISNMFPELRREHYLFSEDGHKNSRRNVDSMFTASVNVEGQGVPV
jgi:hypothetical protein